MSRENTTPSGVVISYEEDELGKGYYTVNTESVPRVSDVLNVLEKGGLVKWAQGVGVEGTLELIRRGHIGRRNGHPMLVESRQPVGVNNPATKDNTVALLKELELSTDHVRDKAGDRGTSVHRALEAWCVDGEYASPHAYPEEERGYVEGLNSFLAALKVDKRSPIMSEIMVGSPTHKFAGRYDLALTLKPSTLQTTLKLKRDVFKGRWMFDLKSSSNLYDSHFWQLEAYEGASIEDGYPPTIGRAAVQVTADGLYRVKVSTKTYDQFLKIRAVYDVVKNLG